MTTMDPAWEALPSFPHDESMPMISQSDGNEAVGDDLSLFASNGSLSKLERELSHTHVHKFLRGKENVGKALSERSGKLTLLELPMDILRLIVQEVWRLLPTKRSPELAKRGPMPFQLFPR